MSVEKRGDGWRVRWRENGRNRSRGPFSKDAADAFDRRVKDLQAAGQLHLLDAVPRGEVSLHDFTWNVWWPEYAEIHLTKSTRDNYATQLDLRIDPKWGKHRLADLRTGPIEAWVSTMRRKGVGDPTILHTLAVMRSILNRAVKDEEIERNPVVGVAKPRQQRSRSPLRITPIYVELLRQRLLEPGERVDSRGRRIPDRDPLTRLQDAALVSVLAYSGPRPESEALPLRWEQIRQRTILYRRTKHTGGKVTERSTRLLGPLARDLAELRLRRFGGADPGALVFPAADGAGWKGHDWDNFRDRIFRPACVDVGLPAHTRLRDLRGSFASLLIFEGLNVVEVAGQLGHSVQTLLRDYADVFEELDPAQRRPAEDIVREARELVRTRPAAELIDQLKRGEVPAQYPATGEASG